MAITYAAKFGDSHIISDGERCEINGQAVERWRWDAARWDGGKIYGVLEAWYTDGRYDYFYIDRDNLPIMSECSRVLSTLDALRILENQFSAI